MKGENGVASVYCVVLPGNPGKQRYFLFETCPVSAKTMCAVLNDNDRYSRAAECRETWFGADKNVKGGSWWLGGE